MQTGEWPGFAGVRPVHRERVMKLMSRMVLHLYTPALAIAGAGLVFAEVVSRLNVGTSGLTSGRVASIGFLLALLIGTAWALHSSWRLYRWTLGREQRCACGGLMSRPRVNRRGEIYRKCIGCGAKTYEHAH